VKIVERILAVAWVVVFAGAVLADYSKTHVFVPHDLTLVLAVAAVIIALLGAVVSESNRCRSGRGGPLW
jgi:peptidoglycan/LPS O-acetylase OafA/YrhL